jgi:2-polyprenyl-3-methyl-5-hydroxy-6-metoxy-1,4-benzoquinol methylase
MFKFRSAKKELLDAEHIPEKALFRNLRELDFINHWLGGYNISFGALQKLLGNDCKYTLVDIGSGGGDTLKRISQWQKSKKWMLSLYGIDIKQICVNYSNSNEPDETISFFCDDYRNIFKHVPEVDIIHASLFCHHLSEDELVELIRFSIQNKAILLINDLERNALAYYSIKFLTAMFSSSYLVRHDAPLSVLRGFKKREWIEIIQKSGAVKYSVKNKWAFRHEVIVYP